MILTPKVNNDSITERMEELKVALEKTEKRIDARTVPNRAELQELVHECEQLREPIAESIFLWLRGAYQESRGFELGTFGAPLLAITMKQQSTKWVDLALGYISDIVALTHSFVMDSYSMLSLRPHALPSEIELFG